MCGIGGIITENASDLIKNFMSLVSHRGPDNYASYRFENLALGHNRLSIIDLSDNGNQPMVFKDRYVIVYNGEIYNYIEIKEELSELGYKFKTNSDTEVLLLAYDKWGRDCLHKFNGMWSFAILDKVKRQLFCSRDRYGIKPFYYYKKNNIFAFASEIKQFTSLPNWKSHLNIEKTLDFLLYDITDHDENSLFSEVKNLRGGHYLIYDLDKKDFKIEKWYNIEDIVTNIQNNGEIKNGTLKKLLIESLKFRLRSDVKVGSCLSGGIDSSSIVCQISEMLDGNSSEFFNTFSACSNDKRFDEQEYMDLVSNKTKLKSFKVFPSYDGFIKNLNKVVWHQDEPFSSASIFAQWCLFEEAKNNGTVVLLDGQGSDEIFAGYTNFFPPHIINQIRYFRIVKSIFEIIHYKKLKNISYSNIIKGIIGNKSINTIKRAFKKNSFSWISDIHKNYKNNSIETNIAKSIQEESYRQIMNTNIPKLLRYEDRNSMAFSIEARVPFLDHRIVEYGCAIDDNMKIKNGVDKYALREDFKDILPEQIYSRNEKLGFVTPEKLWLFTHNDLIKEKLRDAVEISNGLINSNIFNYSDDIYSGKRNYDQTIWKIIIFGEWLKTFNVYV